MNHSKLSEVTYNQESTFVSAVENTTYKPTKRIWLMILVASLSILLALGVHIYILGPMIDKEDQDKNLFFLFKLIFYVANSVYILFLVDIAFDIFSEAVTKSGSKFTEIIVQTKRSQIIASIFFFIIYFFMKTYEDILLKKTIVNALNEDPNSPKITTISGKEAVEALPIVVDFDFKVFLMENFVHITLGVSLVMFLYLIKTIVLEGIDYMMYWCSYFQKLIQTNKDVQTLNLVNSVTQKTITLRSPDWISYVFKVLSPEGTPLNRDTLEYFFSAAETDEILALFDKQNTGSIDEKTFIDTWLSVAYEKKKIKNVVEYKNVLLKKLDYLFSFIFIPIMLFTFMTILGKTEYFTTYGSIVVGFILPLSFIFAGVIGDLFKSIVFVFFVRPFEVGDKIEMMDKIYIVDEIGLLYSTFLNNSLNVTMSNIEIMNKNIVNYRRSEFYEKKYTLKFDIDVYKRVVDDFRKELKNLIDEHSKLLKKKFKLENIVVKEEGKLEVDLIIYADIHSHNLMEGIDEFSIRLDKLVNEIKQK
jgi:hypothetical protein